MSAGGLVTGAAQALMAEAKSLGRLLGVGASRFDDEPLHPGLHAYRRERHGGQTRLHLRVQPDGRGTLFADVTEAVHLSETATEMAWLALEGATFDEAASRLLGRYRGVGRRELASHYEKIFGVIETLSDPRHSCRSCALDLPRTPLFSTPAEVPYKVDLALTYACNNACPHCYNEAERIGLSPASTSRWKEIVDKLADAGVPHLIFTGGEPTLHPGLPEIIAHAEGRGQICGINTNGRRLKDRSYLNELVSAGLDHVQITLHSHDGGVHDAMVGASAFEETVAGLKGALETDLHVLTNTTLTRASAAGAESTVRFLDSLGLRRFAMNGMIRSGGGGSSPDALPMDKLAAVLVQVREVAAELRMRFLWYTVTRYCELSPIELEVGTKRCNAAEYSMCIEPNGDVLPCQSYYEAAGNILRDSWDTFWESELFRSFRERESSPEAAGLSESCKDCPDLSVCGGGCRLEREAGAGAEDEAPACRGCGAAKGTAASSSGLAVEGTRARASGAGVDPGTLCTMSADYESAGRQEGRGAPVVGEGRENAD